MDKLTPCPRCKKEGTAKTEWDGYDGQLICKECGYFTGWHRMPSPESVWNREGRHLVRAQGDI